MGHITNHITILFRAALVLYAGAAGCAVTQSYRVQTDLFAATFPRGWTMEHDAGDQRRYRFVLEGGAEEVHILAWLERGTLADPASEARRRLLEESPVNGGAGQPQGICLDAPHAVTFLGQPASPIHLPTEDGWRAQILGGHTDGTLIAVVARRRTTSGVVSCEVSQDAQRLIASIAPFTSLPLPAAGAITTRVPETNSFRPMPSR